MEVEERLDRARDWHSGEEDLWVHKVALMECCWGMIKGESGVALRLADLYSNLAVSPGPVKPRNLILTLCCSNLCALLTLQSSPSEANHWYLQAKLHCQGLPYLGLASWIEQFRPASLQKPPLHSKSPASRLSKVSLTKEVAALKPTPSFARLIQHSATAPPSVKRPSGKRRKTGQADDYSQIEKLLKHPVAPRAKPALTELSSEDSKADCSARLSRTETSRERRHWSEREAAVVKIQRLWAQYRTQKREKEAKAATFIQIWYRNHLVHIRRQARVRIRTFAQLYTLKTLRIVTLSIRNELKRTKNALTLQCWFRQKLGLVALWLEGKRALESTSDYPLSVSTKPETLTSSFSESRLDFPDPPLTETLRKNTERLRERAAVLIQKTYKAHLTSVKYASLRKAVVHLQAWSRGRTASLHYRRDRQALLRLQNRCRGVLIRRKIAQFRANAVKIQAVYRGWQARKALRRLLSAALRIQRFVRSFRLLPTSLSR